MTSRELNAVRLAMLDAPQGFEVLQATVRTWRHLPGMDQAVTDAGGGMIIGYNLTDRPAPVSMEATSALWFAPDGRLRVERDGSLVIDDGEHVWVSWDDSTVVQHALPEHRLGSLGGLAALVAPSDFVRFFDLELAGQREVAGHPTTVLQATVGDPTVPGRLAAFLVGDRHELCVHRPTGMVLEAQSWFGGVRIVHDRFLSLQLDPELPPSVFRFSPGPGVVVKGEAAWADELQQARDDVGRRLAAARRGTASWAGGPPARASLADRYQPVGASPHDVEAARAAVRGAIEGLGAGDGALRHVQGGANLQPSLAEARRRHPQQAGAARFEVDEVCFVRPDEAVVAFRVSGLAQEGRVVLVGDEWLVERGTFTRLLAIAGVEISPPPV